MRVSKLALRLLFRIEAEGYLLESLQVALTPSFTYQLHIKLGAKYLTIDVEGQQKHVRIWA